MSESGGPTSCRLYFIADFFFFSVGCMCFFQWARVLSAVLEVIRVIECCWVLLLQWLFLGGEGTDWICPSLPSQSLSAGL